MFRRLRPRSKGRPILGMNKGEIEYSKHLALKVASNQIQDFKFEPFKLRLADNTFYTPDFVVVTADGFEIHEVKGGKYKKRTDGSVERSYWCEEDAKIKVKVAAETFWWFKFFIVYPIGNGQWGKDGFNES